MSQEFKAIQILPFTGAEKQQLIKLADDARKSYAIAFKLSSVPDPKWAEMFMINWHKEYGGGTLPRIKGNAVYVNSAIHNLQNALNALKLVTAETNDRFGAVVGKKRIEAAEAHRLKGESKRAAEEAMTNALDKLQF